MLKKLLITAAVLALPVAASAADLPRKGPAYAPPPPPPPYSWTGFYVGVNAGYGLANVTIDDQDCNISCSSQTLTPNGFTAGGTLGYNWQFGSTVLGIEGDWNWIDAKKDISSVDWPSAHHAEIKSFGTARARAGLALDRTLVYVTAGAGFLDRDVSAICAPTSDCFGSGFSSSDTKVGLALGAGVEWAFYDRWSAKLEYLFIKTPTENQIPDVNINAPTFEHCNGRDFCNFNVSNDLQVVRVGINYRFGGKAPY
jgi:outer membrane immunogenic protein